MRHETNVNEMSVCKVIRPHQGIIASVGGYRQKQKSMPCSEIDFAIRMTLKDNNNDDADSDAACNDSIRPNRRLQLFAHLRTKSK